MSISKIFEESKESKIKILEISLLKIIYMCVRKFLKKLFEFQNYSTCDY